MVLWVFSPAGARTMAMLESRETALTAGNNDLRSSEALSFKCTDMYDKVDGCMDVDGWMWMDGCMDVDEWMYGCGCACMMDGCGMYG